MKIAIAEGHFHDRNKIIQVDLTIFITTPFSYSILLLIIIIRKSCKHELMNSKILFITNLTAIQSQSFYW